MKSVLAAVSTSRLHQIQQVFKWVVYSLLFINWLFYFHEDWTRWTHTVSPASGLFDLTSEFATTIDVGAWLILLAMLELETYALDDDVLEGWTSHLIRGIRVLCFVMIGHTVVAFTDTVIDYEHIRPVKGVENLCEMADQGVSHVYNLEYTQVNKANCDALPVNGPLYWLGEGSLVVDRAGLETEQNLAWADLVEVLAWLVIIAAIEIVVRLQDRGITDGVMMSVMKGTKISLYMLLLGLGVYWAFLGHWLYFWDEVLWIGGFAVIEMNVSEWKKEILLERGQLRETGTRIESEAV